MDQISQRLRLAETKPAALDHIVERYVALGSIEAVAHELGVAPRTLYRWRDREPSLRKRIEAAGHTRGAGNMARRRGLSAAAASEALAGVRKGSCVSLAALAEELGVSKATVERWARVYPELETVIAGKLKKSA